MLISFLTTFSSHQKGFLLAWQAAEAVHQCAHRAAPRAWARAQGQEDTFQHNQLLSLAVPAALISDVEQICSTPPRITQPGLPGTPGSSSPGVLNPLKALIRTVILEFLDTLNFLPVHRLTGYVQAPHPPGFICDLPNTQTLNPQLPGSHFALSPPAYLFRCARTRWSKQPPARAGESSQTHCWHPPCLAGRGQPLKENKPLIVISLLLSS